MGRGGGEEEDEESGEFTSLATLWPTHTHTRSSDIITSTHG